MLVFGRVSKQRATVVGNGPGPYCQVAMEDFIVGESTVTDFFSRIVMLMNKLMDRFLLGYSFSIVAIILRVVILSIYSSVPIKIIMMTVRLRVERAKVFVGEN